MTSFGIRLTTYTVDTHVLSCVYHCSDIDVACMCSRNVSAKEEDNSAAKLLTAPVKISEGMKKLGMA